MPQPVKNPVIPGNPKDRTGTAGVLRRYAAQIRRRFEGLSRDVLAIFERIPVYQVNDLRGPEVRYGLTPEQLAGIAEELQAAVARWIAAGRDLSHVMWWEPYTEEAMHLGTAQSASNLAGLSASYAAARSLEAIVYSEPYRTRVAMAKFKSYEHWTGLAAEQRQALAQLIGQAVADGKSPRAVRTLIAEQMGVGKAKALQYAQTDITDTLRQARWAESEAAEAELGIRTGLLWTSAFKPTTRPWHASRSGRVYTPAECRAFYAERGNRYNCYCGQTECLLDANGKPILTKTLQSAMANERKAWQSVHAKG